MVSIRGRVIEQISEDADEDTNRFAKKYLGRDKYPYCFQMKKSHFKKIQKKYSYTIIQSDRMNREQIVRGLK
jgi:hypothetical protein